MTFINEPTVKIGGQDTNPNIDSFHRIRVSNPTTLFDSQLQYSDLTEMFVWTQKLTTGGTSTHVPNASSVTMAVTATSGSEVIRQSRQYWRYQPGKSQFILVTFNFKSGHANTTKRVGYFDDENGIFLEEINGSVWVVIRSNVSGTPVNTRIPQASWNIDIHDGTGPSGMTLDSTKGQILVIDLEWLSMGSVRVGFMHKGQIHYVHRFDHGNILTGPYMTSANLPVRYSITNTAAAAINSMDVICSSVMAEGGFQIDRGFPFIATNGASLIAVTTRRPILSIRPKATFKGITNRSSIILSDINVFADTQPICVEVFHNGTLTGASFSEINADSTVEQDISATAVTGGHLIDAFYLAAGKDGGIQLKDVLSRVPFALDIDAANPDNIVVTATSLSTSTDVGAAIHWLEFR